METSQEEKKVVPAQSGKRGLSTGAKVAIGCGSAIVGVFIIFLIIGYFASKETTNTPTPQAITPTANQTTPTPNIDLSFQAIDKIFGTQSDVTDLQKKEQWPKYQGKKINWTCSVVSVDEALLASGYTLNAKCNPSTFTSDTRIEFSNNWKSKLLTYKENDKVSFSGNLDSYDMFGYNIKNGEIQ